VAVDQYATKTPEQYRKQLVGILPHGKFWGGAAGLSADTYADGYSKPNTRLGRFLMACADSFTALHNKALEVLDEMDPRTTTDMLDAWERNYGLPDPCSPAPTTDSDRQDALWGKVRANGGQTIAYYTEVAAAHGCTITIDEPGLVDAVWGGDATHVARGWVHVYATNGSVLPAGHAIQHTDGNDYTTDVATTWTADEWERIDITADAVGTAFNRDNGVHVTVGAAVPAGVTAECYLVSAWHHHWIVHCPAEFTFFRVTTATMSPRYSVGMIPPATPTGDPLWTKTDKALQLECLFDRIKPAHTIAVYRD